MLKLHEINVDILAAQVLRGLSLAVPSNGMIGLIGQNGAGKTTTMRAIMGLIGVSKGAIHFGDVNLLKLGAHSRARLGIGYMPEDRGLIQRLTVEENILLPSWAIRMKDAPKRLAKIYELMPEVAAFRTRRALQLSGGQQKLVALARALIVGRELLILDEPFEGIAPALVMRLTAVLSELKSEGGRAILISDSSLDHGRSIYDNIVRIERGQIASRSTIEVSVNGDITSVQPEPSTRR
jgi:branched-chain amino acid transport system ATP-binding protein